MQGKSPTLELILVSQKGLREGTTRGGLVRGAHPVVDGSSLACLVPECKASAEKNRASQAFRQEKGNLLEGKERVTGEPTFSLSDGVLLIPHL